MRHYGWEKGWGVRFRGRAHAMRHYGWEKGWGVRFTIPLPW